MGIMKRLAGFALCLAAAAALLPAFGTAAYADEIKYDVWVLGTRVTSDNASDVFGDGKVSYDAASKTLTLGRGGAATGLNSAIYSVDDLVVHVTAADVTLSSKAPGIDCDGKLSIIADGTLNVDAVGYGIHCKKGGLSIAASTLKINVDADSAPRACGIYCEEGDLSISVDGILEVDADLAGIATGAGKVSLTCGTGKVVSHKYGGIASKGGVEIEYGTLEVSSGALGVGIGGYNCVVVVKGGALTVEGGDAGIRGQSLNVVSGTVDAQCTYGDSDANDGYHYAIECKEFDREGLNVLAATEVNGTFEEYDQSKFNLYDHVKIAPVSSEPGGTTPGGGNQQPGGTTPEGGDQPGDGDQGGSQQPGGNEPGNGDEGGNDPGNQLPGGTFEPEGGSDEGAEDGKIEQPSASEPSKNEKAAIAQTGDDVPFAGMLATVAAAGIAVLALRRRVA